jgi:thermopsin
MSKMETFGYDMSHGRINWLTASLGVLVTLLMVLSAIAGVALANGGFHSQSAVASNTAASTPAKVASSAAATATKTTPKGEEQLMQYLKSHPEQAKYAYLPNFNAMSGVSTPAQGEPSCEGSLVPCVAPAAMGIADYGAVASGGTLVPYSYTTTSFMATTTITSLNDFAVLTGPDSFGMQLNTILQNVTVGNSVMNGTAPNTYWTQNVPGYTVSTHTLSFVDNVWNFSNSAMSMGNKVVTGNGTVANDEYYYTIYPTNGQITVAPPFTLKLWNTAAVTATAPYATQSEFWFELTTPSNNPFTYPLWNGTMVSGNDLTVNYDTVTFNSTATAAPTSTPSYMVNGNADTAVDIPYDAEMILGGPGAGADTTFYGMSATMQLQYYDGTAYQNVKSAWDVGSETGETCEGVSEWWTTPGIVNLGPGPSIIYPLWNASTTTPTSGDWGVVMTLKPSNAFVFMEVGPTYDVNMTAWAPGPWSGNDVTYNLPPLGFIVNVMLSNYDPMFLSINAGGVYTVTLTADTGMGVYTPLFAFNNAQLANISSSGSGTLAAPYVLSAQAAGYTINDSFQEFNDYLFPVFPGVLIANTNAYVDMNNSGSFEIMYNDVGWLYIYTTYEGLNLPMTNYMQIQTYNVMYFSVMQSTITGWMVVPTYFPGSNLLLWNSTNCLVANDMFYSIGWSVEAYNAPYVMDANNVFWGNLFTNNPQFSPAGMVSLQLSENGDTVYNNYFALANSVVTPSSDIWDGATVSYVDAWNVPYNQPLQTVNGYQTYSTLIAGYISVVSWVGGNYWVNFPCGGATIGSIPFTDYGMITVGDFLPLCSIGLPVVFQETGLTAGTPWVVTYNGMPETTPYSYASFLGLPGSDNFYTINSVGTAAPSPSAGDVPLVGSEVTVPVVFIAGTVPTLKVLAPTSGYTISGRTNFTVVFSVTGVPAADYANLVAQVNLTTKYTSVGETLAWNYFNSGLVPVTAGVNTMQITKDDLSLPSGVVGDLPYSAYSIFVTVYNGSYTSITPPPLASTWPSQGVTIYRAFAAITAPVTGNTLTANTPFVISASYDWSEWYSATNATLIITNSATQAVVDSLTVKLTAGDTGTWAPSVSLPTGNYTIGVDFATLGSNSQWVNASTVKVTVVSSITPIVYVNATVTKYQNSTLGAVQIVGAILIVVGLAVGFIIGYMLMKTSRPKNPSPQTWSPSGGSSTPPPGSP